MRALPQTFRGRLTVGYSAVLTLVLAGFGVCLYLIVRGQLLHLHDPQLRQSADAVQAVIGQHEDCEHLTPDQVAQLNRYSKLVLFHSVGGDPAVFYGSPDLESLEAARDLVATPQFLEERSAFRTYAEAGGYLRVYTRPYRSHAGRQGVIRVMERMGDVGLLLSNFRIALLLLAPIVVAVAAAVSWWLAGRALTPVVVVTELAREIEATQLSRRLPGRPVPDEIGRLIETFNQMVVESFSERAAALGVRLEMTPSPEVLIPGDERWLRQLVLNLVDNAVRFSVRGEGRAAGSAVAVSASVAVTVTASVSADDEQASLVVDDGGPGIPEADLDRVFERFYRGVPGPRDGRVPPTAPPSTRRAAAASAVRPIPRTGGQ